jgi:hypothetical protein
MDKQQYTIVPVISGTVCIESKRTTRTSTATDTGKKQQHTVFVDSARDVQQFDVLDHFDTVPELVVQVFNQPRKAALQPQQQATISSSHA